MKNSVVDFAAGRRIRRLAIEELEPRTYLAADTINISSPSGYYEPYYTSIVEDPVSKSLSFANPTPQFVIGHDTPSIPAISEGILLSDPSLTFTVQGVNGDETSLDIQTHRDSTMASIWIQPASGFTGGQVLVGICHEDDLVSAHWLATQVITITVQPPDPSVDLSLTATTPDGAPLDELHVGEDFVVHVWAQDIRKDPHGVFAAYMNLNWDGILATVNGQPNYGEHFSNGQSGFADAPGSMSRIGGFGDAAVTKGIRYEVFSVPMHATAAGDFMISSSAICDGSPAFNILEYGNDLPINTAAVQFGKLSIHIADAAGGQTHEERKDNPVQEPRTNPTDPINQRIESSAVALSLSATTVDGRPINELHVGESFILHVWVQDIRKDAHGVFAAYLNLNWDSSLASLAGNTSHGEHFFNGKKDGNAAPGSLDRAGGFDGGISETKSSRFEVFSVPMHASAGGEFSIATSSAVDGTPLYWILEYGIDGEIPVDAIQFGKLSIHVAAGSPGQTSPNTADGPTFDSQTIPENETSTIPQTAIPTIIVTAPTDSSAAAIAVNIRDLLSPELKAAIASRAPLSPVLIADSPSNELESTAKLELSIL